MEVDGQTIAGGKGNSALNDSSVNKILNKLFGSENKVPTINCKDQNRDTMAPQAGDLFKNSLWFRSEKNNPEHIPELDVWVRPFDAEDKNTAPVTEDMTVRWFIVLPDPIPAEKQSKTGENNKVGGDEQVSGNQQDWYIIPYKNIKDRGDQTDQ